MPSGSEVIECPASGCEYTGVRTSVLAHYSGKQDDVHKGGYLKAQERMENADVIGTVDSDDGDEIEDSDGKNPIMGDGPDKPVSGFDTGSETDTDADPICPSCSGDLVDYRQYADGQYHEINGSNHYVRGDFLCTGCGRWWVDE